MIQVYLLNQTQNVPNLVSVQSSALTTATSLFFTASPFVATRNNYDWIYDGTRPKTSKSNEKAHDGPDIPRASPFKRQAEYSFGKRSQVPIHRRSRLIPSSATLLYLGLYVESGEGSSAGS